MKNALKIKKGDVLIIAVLSLFCAALFAFPFFLRSEKTVAVVFLDGEKKEEIDLSSVESSHRLDVGGCVLLVEKGKISFLDADCPDRLCVKSGVLSKNGDTAACVPNKVVVRIENKKESFDAVAF